MKTLKGILIVLSLMFLVNCESEDVNPKFILEGTYVDGSGQIDGQDILSFDVVDNFETLDVYFNTGSVVTKCTYSFFEDLGDTIYFVSIPNETSSLLIMSIEDVKDGALFSTVGPMDLNSQDVCQKVQIINAFKNIGINTVSTF